MERETLDRDMRIGAFIRSFAAAALAYATVELWLIEILRRITAGDAFVRTNRAFAATAFVTYAVIGGVIGLLVAVALRAAGRTAPRRELATLFLLIAAIVNLA